jgi:hypothetical protein
MDDFSLCGSSADTPRGRAKAKGVQVEDIQQPLHSSIGSE